MAKRLYLASSNKGKARELATLAEAEGIELALLPGYEKLPRFPEKDTSFAMNAVEKALHYSRHTDELVAADDSGIVVDALDGRPGVRSARYAGPDATDEQNNWKLLDELRGLPDDQRAARYVCVLALARRDRVLGVFSDSCEGRILNQPRGHGGFGYDPLFFFPPLGRSMAELSVEEKNQHSHRGKAFQKLLTHLKERPAPPGAQ